MALILSGGDGGNATITGNSGNLTVSNAANIFTGGIISATGTITSAGNLSLVGNIVDTGPLWINTTANGNITLNPNGTGQSLVTTGLSVAGNVIGNNATISTSLAVGNTTPTGTAGQIVATNSITAFYSDHRLKANIQPIINALDKVDQLSGVTYTQNKFAEQFGYNDYSQQVGVIAQQVQEVLPEVVKLAPFDMGPDGTSRSGENYLTVQYEKLVPLLIQAVKELNQEVKILKEIIKNADSSS